MKTTGFRSFVLYILLFAFCGGFVWFLINLALNGSTWATQPYNGHIYGDDTAVSAGTITDRSGMVLAEPEVLQAMEHSALESPCYLPIAVKRDGAVTGSLASAEQLGKLSKYVDHILHEITQEVFAGNIDADPYARTPQQSACTYCEFASACHFENGCGSDRMEYIKATKNDEFWQYIDEVNGEGARENG